MNPFFNRSRKKPNSRFANSKKPRRILLLAVLGFPLLFFSRERRAAAQAPAEKTTAATVVVRACPAGFADSRPARKPKPKGKGAAARSNELPPACLEASASPLDIQEFFQSFVRAQGWNIGEEQGTEDLWTFARYLGKDDLLRFAKEGLFAGRVNWRDGRALVQVRTVELDGGFTRVLVSARFEGYGESVDQFAPPKDSWQLNSNGTLENSMISALQMHFRSLR